MASRFFRSRNGVVGVVLVGLILAGAVLGPWLDVHPAVGKDVLHGLSPLGAPLPPSAAWPLGTDMLGRCVAARLAAGALASLEIGLLATLTALVIGTAVGVLAGWAGGRTDQALMRTVDLVLAFPFLILVLVIAALLRESGTGRGTVLIVLGAVGWTTAARVIRARVLTLRASGFVLAARAGGAGAWRILGRHILPNVLPTVIAVGAPTVAQMILAESALSYLGLGSGPPTPTWGRMLSEGQSYLRGAPWLVVAPALAALSAALGFNLLGDGLRDAMDPRAR